jgi:peptidoglycan/LPS O-acetylase OafA/YrhL
MGRRVRAGSAKLIELESLRGIAAFVVLLHHFLLEFAPHLHGRNFPDDPTAMVRSPLFALINGSAAVAVFFVLSGFVLTFRAMERRDWRQIVVGAAKRWPRLALLVLIVNLCSAVFLILGLYVHQGYAWTNPQTYQGPVDIIMNAFREGLYKTFWERSAYFNPSIWTMRYEFYGSLLSYGCALLVLTSRSFGISLWIGSAVLLFTAVSFGNDGGYFAMLIAGVMIARVYISRSIEFNTTVTVAFAVCAILLCGYDGLSRPTGFYSFMEPIASLKTEQIVHGLGAVMVLSLALFAEPVRWVLNMPYARMLGRLSFPIYLVHLPILSAIVFPFWTALSWLPEGIALVAAFALFTGLTFVTAYPLAMIDEWWVGRLRDLTGMRLLNATNLHRAA